MSLFSHNPFIPIDGQILAPELQEKLAGLKPMKVIRVDNEKRDNASRNYLKLPPEQTHTKEELESLHRAIRFTQMFKQEESSAKMNEEELIRRPLPRFGGI